MTKINFLKNHLGLSLDRFPQITNIFNNTHNKSKVSNSKLLKLLVLDQYNKFP